MIPPPKYPNQWGANRRSYDAMPRQAALSGPRATLKHIRYRVRLFQLVIGLQCAMTIWIVHQLRNGTGSMEEMRNTIMRQADLIDRQDALMRQQSQALKNLTAVCSIQSR